jgi:hypothetical protein
MKHWGRVSEPTITATCSLCGLQDTFTLEEELRSDEYEDEPHCLERNEWQAYPSVLCEGCKSSLESDDDD